MLVLGVLQSGSLHGFGILRRIQQTSGELLKIEEGSLYPALHRMERKGWIKSEWCESEAKRRAKYYKLTKLGKKQFVLEEQKWNRLVKAVDSVMSWAGGA
jgi:transcriptional regulator